MERVFGRERRVPLKVRVILAISPILASAALLLSALLWANAADKRGELCRAITPTAVLYDFILMIPPSPEEQTRPTQSREFRRLLRQGVHAVDKLDCVPPRRKVELP